MYFSAVHRTADMSQERDFSSKTSLLPKMKSLSFHGCSDISANICRHFISKLENLTELDFQYGSYFERDFTMLGDWSKYVIPLRHLKIFNVPPILEVDVKKLLNQASFAKNLHKFDLSNAVDLDNECFSLLVLRFQMLRELKIDLTRSISSNADREDSSPRSLVGCLHYLPKLKNLDFLCCRTELDEKEKKLVPSFFHKSTYVASW